MFVRTLALRYTAATGETLPCPIQWLDSFAMRNFTNDAVFDDTLPIADGLLQAGLRVPAGLLQERMGEWFHRKGYLRPGENLQVVPLPA